MPSWSLPISVRLHNCAPVAAFRATADVAVAVYTTPPATVTPSGPPFAELYSCIHKTLPVARLIAYTLESRSWT
jgi:hypothetical protein